MTRKIFLSLVFFGAFACACCSCAKREIANINSHGTAIICFGDSITYGTNASTDKSYPSILSTLLGKDVINAGRSGDTTASALNRLDEDVLAKDPLVVVVILGGNDFLQQMPEENIFSNLKTIIERIQAKGAMVALGQLGPFTMYTLKTRYEKLAREERCIFIPNVLAGIFGDPEMMSDSIHPNEKGYAKMAQKVYRAIQPALAENGTLR